MTKTVVSFYLFSQIFSKLEVDEPIIKVNKMQLLSGASFVEYVRWYLDREFIKNKRSEDNPSRFAGDEEMLEYMENKHGGKLQEWFRDAKWKIYKLDPSIDLHNLVCLEGEWTKKYLIPDDLRIQKDYRILKQMVKNAKELNYFTKTHADIIALGDSPDNRFKYYNNYKDLPDKALPALTGGNRIVLRSLGENESKSNPSGNYYLHDGFGRLLTYQYLISVCDFRLDGDIEAFLVEE